MAWAIMGGLFIATLLTLLFLPALYASWYGTRQALQSRPNPDHSLTTSALASTTMAASSAHA
jgi:hypothetical protein